MAETVAQPPPIEAPKPHPPLSFWGKLWRIVVGAVLLAATLATAVLFLKARHAQLLSDPERARAAGDPIPVRTFTVSASDADKVIGGTSLTVPSKRAAIATNVSRSINMLGGTLSTPAGLVVKRVLVKRGDYVHRGDTVVEFDNSDFVTLSKALESVRAASASEVEYREKALDANKILRALDVTRADTEVKYREVALDAHTKIRDALEKLSKTGATGMFNFYEAVSKLAAADFALAASKLDQSRANINLTIGLLRDQFDLAAAVGKREETAAALELTHRNAESCVLKSPLDGYVDKLEIEPGEVLHGDANITDVLQLDPIWVCMDFPQERLGELVIGQQAEVVVDSFPRETFHGKVVAALPQVNPETRTLAVYIEVSNPGGRIRSGVSGFSRITVAAPGAIVVPATALMQDRTNAMVFCIESGHAQIRKVVPGHVVENGRWEVLQGLAPGDEVVIFGNKDLREGDAVDTDWHTWSRRN